MMQSLLQQHPKFVKAKKWDIHLSSSQPSRACFQFLKTKLKAVGPTKKQQVKVAAVKALQSISGEETQHLVMCMDSFWTSGSINIPQYKTKLIFNIILICPIDFELLKMGERVKWILFHNNNAEFL